ncbi:hypothetical protein HMI54_008930 [Coelomomyces lativittatus]|nr:hypothetical protein HMI54_008930 [Coelomomyces lativittatus]
MKCPGCEYDGSLCSCNYTTSKINENSLIQLMGTKTCVYPPRKNNEVQCETLTSSYPDTYCSTLLNASECQFSSPICDNLCTPTYTITQATPQTVQGYRLCSLSDSRPFGKLPINCIGTVKTTHITCENTLQPVDCTTQSICKKIMPSCAPGNRTASTTVTCDTFTLTKEKYGGTKCLPSPTKIKTYTTTCTPSTQPQHCLGEAFEFNVIIYGNASAIHGSAGGRVGVQGLAKFLDYTIGSELSLLEEECIQTIPNALIVEKDLIYYGNVMNGNIYVEGFCNDEIESNCNVVCYENDKNIKDSCKEKPFNFNESYLLLQKRSRQWKDLNPTAKYTVKNRMVEVEWSGSNIEVLNMTLDSLIPPWNSFTSNLAVDATIIINIQNTGTVEFRHFSLEYFKSRTNKVIWNFYRASRVIIKRMTLYGLVIVPFGTITGNGRIHGSAYAFNMDIYNFNTSLLFKWERYVGFCF